MYVDGVNAYKSIDSVNKGSSASITQIEKVTPEFKTEGENTSKATESTKKAEIININQGVSLEIKNKNQEMAEKTAELKMKMAEEDAERRKITDEHNKVQFPNSEIKIGIHEKTERITIKIVDRDTKEVLKEFPPEKSLDLIAKSLELAGVLVDEKM